MATTGAVLPTSITSAQPATTNNTAGDETQQPYLVLITQGGVPNVAEQNSTVSAFGRNFCSTQDCSVVTLSIGNEFVANQTIANVTVQNDGTFAVNFTVNVPFPFRYVVTASQTASNGTLFTASVPISIPVSDPKEEEQQPIPQPASFSVKPKSFSGAIIPVGPPIPSASAISDFNPNIPYGGRGVAVDVSPANSAVAIVASESGGLWKTTDAGATWLHLDGLPLFDMSDVKFAPGNDQIVITTGLAVSYGLGNIGGIWRSTDGGATWTKPPTADPTPGSSCPSPSNGYGIAFAPGTTDVFIGTDCGLSVSHDLGATWTHVVPNSGSSLAPRVWGVNAQAGSSGSTIVDSCGEGGHYRSADGGATWTSTNTASPSCLWYVHVIAASPLESNVLFAAVDGQQLYESDDGGATWTNLNPNQPTCCGRGPWVATHLSSDGNPNHFDIYFAGGSGNTVLRQTCTNTGGPGLRCSTSSWNSVSTQHADPNGLAFSSSSDNCAQYIVTDGGIETTSDCGATWRLTGSGVGGYHALQVYEVTGQVHPDHTDLYFGTQDNDLWASGDNGATWPTNVCCEGFFIQTPHSSPTHSGQTTTFTACAGCSNLQSGAHFSSAAGWNNPPGGGGNPFLIEQGVYIQWSNPSPPTSQLYLTTDGGATWTAVNGASTTLQLWGHPFISGDSANPVIYQGVLRPGNVIGMIKITGVRTGAATISNADSGLNTIGTFPTMFVWSTVFGVDPNNPQHLIAADAGASKMMVSTDGGTTWSPDDLLTRLVSNFGQFDFTIRCEGSACFTQATNIAFDLSNGNRILVGTHQSGIFSSLNGGATWGMLSGSNLVPHVSSFFFDEVQNDVIASSYGRSLWKLDLSANRPPVANDQSVTTNQNTPLPITLTATDPDGDPVTYSIEIGPSHGSLNMFNPSTGTLIYTPIPSYFGPDSFTFKATDSRGADSNIATVSIEVKGPPDCNNPTIVGNDARNDVISGTLGNDVIDGLGGNDVIFGNGGNDEICGGNDNDVINSGNGDDRINGGDGNDIINSGAGKDQLYGTGRNDVINSGAGDDLIDGGPNRDIGNAGPGQDICFNVEIASNCEA